MPRKETTTPVVDLTQEDSNDDNPVMDLTATGSTQQPSAAAAASRRAAPQRAAGGAATAAPGAGAAAAAGPSKRKRKSKAVDEDAKDAAGLPAAPAAKKKREKAPPKEKRSNAAGRTVPWSGKASQKTRERIERALPGSGGHRLFLIARKTVAPLGSEGGPIEEFAILGATGNCYTVKVGRHPSCSCPDAAKGNVCKHYLFVMLRVIRLDQNDPLVWQRALLTAEAEEVLAGNRSTRSPAADVLASDAVRQQWSRSTGGEAGPSLQAAAASSNARPTDGECPICFDSLQEGQTASQRRLATCGTCGNHSHDECFQRWAQQKRQTGVAVTCVYCRSPWQNPNAAGPSSAADGQFLNLSQYSEAHRTANASLDTLYGANAVWIRHHQHGGNRRDAVMLFNQLRGV